MTKELLSVAPDSAGSTTPSENKDKGLSELRSAAHMVECKVHDQVQRERTLDHMQEQASMVALPPSPVVTSDPMTIATSPDTLLSPASEHDAQLGSMCDAGGSSLPLIVTRSPSPVPVADAPTPKMAMTPMASASQLRLSRLAMEADQLAASERARLRKERMKAAADTVVAAAKAAKAAQALAEAAKSMELIQKQTADKNAVQELAKDVKENEQEEQAVPETPVSALEGPLDVQSSRVTSPISPHLNHQPLSNQPSPLDVSNHTLPNTLDHPTTPATPTASTTPTTPTTPTKLQSTHDHEREMNDVGTVTGSPVIQDNMAKAAIPMPLHTTETSPHITSTDEHVPSAEAEPSKDSLVDRRVDHRLHSINELMKTEETYCQNLSILVTYFFEAIKSTTCITPDQRALLIRNAYEILEFQNQFSESLREVYFSDADVPGSEAGNPKKIALFFCDQASSFEIYNAYCIQQDHAHQIYKELLETNEAFAELIERLHVFHRSGTGCSRLTLDDYLIMPFQHLLRYRLILDNISKRYSDCPDIAEAFDKAQDLMHRVATAVNEKKSLLEAERKTNLFLARLEPDWALSQRFYGLLGCCLLIGTLDIRHDPEMPKPRRYGCALFASYMIIVKVKKSDRYEPRHWFPLRLFTLECPTKTQGDTNGSGSSFMRHRWLLTNGQHCLEFNALCDQEKQLWMETMGRAIQSAKDQHNKRLANDQPNDALEQLFVSSFDANQPAMVHKSSSYSSLHTVFGRQESQVPSASQAQDNASKGDQATPETPVSATDTPEDEDEPLGAEPPSPSARTKKQRAWTGNQSARSSIYSQSGAASETPQSQGSFIDLCEFFSNAVVDKWSQHKYNQYHNRCDQVDTRFRDVCSTPVLTARMHVTNDRCSQIDPWRRRSQMLKSTSTLAFNGAKQEEELDTPRSSNSIHASRCGMPPPQGIHSGARNNGGFGNTIRQAVRRKASLPSCFRADKADVVPRSSISSPVLQDRSRNHPPFPPSMQRMSGSTIFQLASRNSSDHPVPRPVPRQMRDARPLPSEPLPRSLSIATMGLARSSGRFLGRMVEKLGNLGTPNRSKHGSHARTSSFASSSSTLTNGTQETAVPLDSRPSRKTKAKKRQDREPLRILIPQTSASNASLPTITQKIIHQDKDVKANTKATY